MLASNTTSSKPYFPGILLSVLHVWILLLMMMTIWNRSLFYSVLETRHGIYRDWPRNTHPGYIVMKPQRWPVKVMWISQRLGWPLIANNSKDVNGLKPQDLLLPKTYLNTHLLQDSCVFMPLFVCSIFFIFFSDRFYLNPYHLSCQREKKKASKHIHICLKSNGETVS